MVYVSHAKGNISIFANSEEVVESLLEGIHEGLGKMEKFETKMGEAKVKPNKFHNETKLNERKGLFDRKQTEFSFYAASKFTGDGKNHYEWNIDNFFTLFPYSVKHLENGRQILEICENADFMVCFQFLDETEELEDLYYKICSFSHKANTPLKQSELKVYRKRTIPYTAKNLIRLQVCKEGEVWDEKNTRFLPLWVEYADLTDGEKKNYLNQIESMGKEEKRVCLDALVEALPKEIGVHKEGYFGESSPAKASEVLRRVFSQSEDDIEIDGIDIVENDFVETKERSENPIKKLEEIETTQTTENVAHEELQESESSAPNEEIEERETEVETQDVGDEKTVPSEENEAPLMKDSQDNASSPFIGNTDEQEIENKSEYSENEEDDSSVESEQMSSEIPQTDISPSSLANEAESSKYEAVAPMTENAETSVEKPQVETEDSEKEKETSIEMSKETDSSLLEENTNEREAEDESEISESKKLDSETKEDIPPILEANEPENEEESISKENTDSNSDDTDETKDTDSSQDEISKPLLGMQELRPMEERTEESKDPDLESMTGLSAYAVTVFLKKMVQLNIKTETEKDAVRIAQNLISDHTNTDTIFRGMNDPIILSILPKKGQSDYDVFLVATGWKQEHVYVDSENDIEVAIKSMLENEYGKNLITWQIMQTQKGFDKK